jgi:hypothetical protein
VCPTLASVILSERSESKDLRLPFGFFQPTTRASIDLQILSHALQIISANSLNWI